MTYLLDIEEAARQPLTDISNIYWSHTEAIGGEKEWVLRNLTKADFSILQCIICISLIVIELQKWLYNKMAKPDLYPITSLISVSSTY